MNAVDDGYRNTTEFLRARLRISAAEARRRLALAGDLLPRTGIGGRNCCPPSARNSAPPSPPAEVASRTATIITAALDRVRHICDPDTAARMEHALTRTAAENDPDFLVRVARNLADAIDQDGAEPSEELLRQLQGAFIRRPRHGLHHLEIFATTEQFEHLLTVMNTATNPRTSTPDPAAATGKAAATRPHRRRRSGTDGPPRTAHRRRPARPAVPPRVAAVSGSAGVSAAPRRGRVTVAPSRFRPLERGFRHARPAAWSHPRELRHAAEAPRRPRRRLQGRPRHRRPARHRRTPAPGHGHHRLPRPPGPPRPHRRPRSRSAPARPAGAAPGRPERTGTLLFTGPVTASTVRKIACDADIIPVLLGSEGRILDIGRTTRIFPPHIRKALTARDQGCAFPGCTIPAPWCEAHHITYWSRGGTTGTDNGTLLCSHHHHLIHKEQWTIQIRSRDPLVHPATTPRPPPKTPTQPLLPSGHSASHRIATPLQLRSGRARGGVRLRTMPYLRAADYSTVPGRRSYEFSREVIPKLIDCSSVKFPTLARTVHCGVICRAVTVSPVLSTASAPPQPSENRTPFSPPLTAVSICEGLPDAGLT